MKLETAVEMLLKYHLLYLMRRRNQQQQQQGEDNNSDLMPLASQQVFLILEALLDGACESADDLFLTGSNLDMLQSTDSTHSSLGSANLVDLTTLLTILISSKIPQHKLKLTTSSTTSSALVDRSSSSSLSMKTADNEEPAAYKQIEATNNNEHQQKQQQHQKPKVNNSNVMMMKSLISKYLTQSNDAGNNLVSASTVTTTTMLTDSSHKLEHHLAKPKTARDEQLAKKPVKEVLTYMMRKHFYLNDGLKIVLDECDLNLKALNKYKEVNSDGFSTNQSGADLLTDLSFVLKLFQLPLTNADIDHDDDGDGESEQKENNDDDQEEEDDPKCDPKDLDNLNRLLALVVNTQVAAIATAAADLKATTNQENDLVKESHNYQSQIVKLANSILDVYLETIEKLNLNGPWSTKSKTAYRQRLLRNSLAKITLAMFNAVRQLIAQFDADDNEEIDLNSDLSFMISKLIQLLKRLLVSKRSNDNVSNRNSMSIELSQELLHLDDSYSTRQIFGMLNRDPAKFYLVLFYLLRNSFKKCKTIYSNYLSNYPSHSHKQQHVKFKIEW